MHRYKINDSTKIGHLKQEINSSEPWRTKMVFGPEDINRDFLA